MREVVYCASEHESVGKGRDFEDVNNSVRNWSGLRHFFETRHVQNSLQSDLNWAQLESDEQSRTGTHPRKTDSDQFFGRSEGYLMLDRTCTA